LLYYLHMLTLFNTLTKEKQEFAPINPRKVGLYCCGPTVYDAIHIGNLRSFIFADLLHRTLQARGYATAFVMNITDVDDKTIKKSQAEGKTLKETTEFYTKIFLEDLEKANIVLPDRMPKATEEIGGMVQIVKLLLAKGIAYETDNGDIYFSIAKFKGYGKIAQVDLSHLKQNAGGRMNNADEYEKDDLRDFALWKAYSPEDGEVFWETEIGKGRPGWHIECSAMSTKYLGQPFDIHLGGIDLLFPHHTNEMAQSEAAYGKPLANYWLHAEHLLVDNAKMSKSKNNFFTAREILDKGFSLLAFRYLVLSSHYRSKLNFTWESLQGAQNALNNLYKEVSIMGPARNVLPEFDSAFMKAINDDLNTAKGLAVVWDLLKSENEGTDKLATLLKFDQVLGLKIKEVWEATSILPDTVQKLAQERDQARADKDFARSDELRIAIESNGYIVEDTPDGTRLKKRH
jgi:cysteinyl-tRNA synthetase